MPDASARSVGSTLRGMRAEAFDLLGAGAVVLDGAGVILDTNESWRLFAHLNDGDPAATGVGAHYLAVCDRAAAAGAVGADEVAAGLRAVLSGERLRMDFEYPCPSPNEDRWFLMQASWAPIVDGTGGVVFHVDITSRKLLSNRLEVLASDDELTGLPNRRSAVEYLDAQLGLARVNGGSVSVHFIDLDNLDDVNDRHGRHVGDELICKVAVRARRDLRAQDRLCRFGGGEFVLICPGLGRTGALRLADRLHTLMHEPFQIGEIEVRARVSVGFAESRSDSTVDSLLGSADHEMHIGKRGATGQSSRSGRSGATAGARGRNARPGSAGPGGRPSGGSGRELIAHGRRLAVWASAQRVIASLELDPADVAVRVAEWAVAVSGADAVTVEVRDGEDLVCQAASGLPGTHVGLRRPLAGSDAAACMASEKAEVWGGVDRPGGPAVDWGLRSGVVAPLVATDGVAAVGVLTVASRRADAFDDLDVLALEVLAGIAGGFLAKAERLIVLERTAARYGALVEHLPGTAVMVFDRELCLVLVAGPGSPLWDAERDVVPGVALHELVTPAEFSILEPFCLAALVEAGTLEYRSADTGLELHIAAVPIPNLQGEIDQLMVLVSDVTQVKADEAARVEAESRYRIAFDEGPVGMSRTALSGRFEAVNEALCALTGYTADQLCASDFASITHPDDIDLGRYAVASMVSGASDVHRTEKRLLHADGHELWVALSTAIVRDTDDRPLYFLSHFLDITDRKRFESELHHLEEHDPITGLANRSSFKAMLNRQVSTVARHGQSGALLVLDLDHFKQINDTLGHRAGDQLIGSLASIVRSQVGPTDVVGRLGGDEFGVMLPYATRAQAERLAGNLLDTIRVEATVLAGDHRRRVTTSIGIAMFDDTSANGAEVFVNADLAMYDAKEAGRDRYAFHERAASQPSTRARLAWVDRITEALDDDRFTLFAQPIMHLASREITRHELLLRMIDDNGEFISPALFLGVAEKFGLINRVDRWVVDAAISALAAHTDLDLSFEVNLSGVSMGDADFLAFIERRLAESPGVDPSRLTFEVTETAAVANLSKAREFADRLTTLGCSFALDDFGSGFGGFYYLKYLPFNDLKIDGEFIVHCVDDLTDRLVIDAVVTIARGLGKCTIAEYVEDGATLEYLATSGVDYAQGFHVGRPIPLEEALHRYRQHDP